MDISEKILAVLQQRGWSKKDLADRMNMPAQNINSTVLNNPKFTVLERVADALELPLSELVSEGNGEPVPTNGELTIKCEKCGNIIRLKAEQ